MVNITRARSSVKIKFVLIRREVKYELKTITFMSYVEMLKSCFRETFLMETIQHLREII